MTLIDTAEPDAEPKVFENVSSVDDLVSSTDMNSLYEKQTNYYHIIFNGIGDDVGNQIHEITEDTTAYVYYDNVGLLTFDNIPDNVIRSKPSTILLDLEPKLPAPMIEMTAVSAEGAYDIYSANFSGSEDACYEFIGAQTFEGELIPTTEITITSSSEVKCNQIVVIRASDWDGSNFQLVFSDNIDHSTANTLFIRSLRNS